MTPRFTRIAALVMALLMVTSCANFRPRSGPPWMQDLLRKGPEDAPTLFKQGWVDGCETGISATANAFIRHFYTFKQDPNHSQNREYYIGWKTAFWYCSRYTMQYSRRQFL
tara:strand:- start:2255 stop:2587 length:333 start_codon:yes stop_codon:yes gene_type:complete